MLTQACCNTTGGGNGLWTTRLFRRNELITEYCGPIIDHKKALQLRRKNKHSHIRVLNSQVCMMKPDT